MKRGDIRVLGARVLRDAAAFDAVFDSGRLCHAERKHCDCGGPDRQRRVDRGEGYDLEGLKRFLRRVGKGRACAVPTILSVKQGGGHASLCPPYESYFGSQPFGASSNFAKSKSRCDGAADQCPVAGAFGRLHACGGTMA